MLVLWAVALLSGAISVLTPCVLPLLPAVLAVSASGGRRRPWGIVVGLTVTFGVAILVLSATVRALHTPSNALVYAAATVMGAFGLVLLLPPLSRMFQRATQVVVRRAPRVDDSTSGFWGGLLAGVSFGLVWTPCAGPIVAAVTAAAATQRLGSTTVAVTVAYVIGMAVPLTAIVFGGQRASGWLRAHVGDGRIVLQGTGVLLLATAAFVGFGYETRVDSFLATHTRISSTPIAGLEHAAINGHATAGPITAAAPVAEQAADTTPADLKLTTFAADQVRKHGYPQSDGIVNYGAAPDVSGISRWYNTAGSQPVSLAGYRGKVVLVDFWAFTCVNCLRALPHVKTLYAKYHDKGFEVIGVHTPELDVERDPDNLAHAIQQLGVRYPVAMDPQYSTWSAWGNQFWPAQYLVDQQGRLRAVHYGEGDYDGLDSEVASLMRSGGNA